MAGDWIKMRGNLWDDPRVAKLCDVTDQSEATVVGALYWLWATADQHTSDGVMPGLSLRQVDRKTGIPGFGQALCDIGWLADHSEGIRVVNFEEHNGQSAKRRATDAQRKATVRKVSAPEADKPQTDGGAVVELEKEKRREEKDTQEASADALADSAIEKPTVRKPTTLKAYLDNRRDAGLAPMDEDCEASKYADSIGLPADFLRLAWREFRRQHVDGDRSSKRQKSWPQTFANAVRGNWYKLWWLNGTAYELTTTGKQAELAAQTKKEAA